MSAYQKVEHALKSNFQWNTYENMVRSRKQNMEFLGYLYNCFAFAESQKIAVSLNKFKYSGAN